MVGKFRLRTTKKERVEALRKLYPDLTDEELAIADANLDEYVKAVLEIVDRLAGKSEKRRRDSQL